MLRASRGLHVAAVTASGLVLAASAAWVLARPAAPPLPVSVLAPPACHGGAWLGGGADASTTESR